MKRIAMLFVVLALALGSFASAQTIAPYVDAGISASSTLTGNSNVTAKNPNYIVGAGVEVNTKLFLLDVNAAFNTGNYRTFGISQINGSSYAATVQGTGFVKVGKLLLGGGT